MKLQIVITQQTRLGSPVATAMAAIMAKAPAMDLPPANSTTLHIRLVCLNRNLYLGGTAYIPGPAKILLTNDAILESLMI